MTPFFIIETLYISIAVGFFTATYIEGVRAGDAFGLRRLAGLLACSIWPMLLVIVLLRFPRAQADVPNHFGVVKGN